jgi:hypothetical protein
MEVTSIGQPTLNQILERKPDVFICSSGYESRASHLASLFKIPGTRLISIGHAEHRDVASRISNDKIFTSLGYENPILPGSSTLETRQLFKAIISEINTNSCRLVVDISSMTRAWFGSIVHSIWTETAIRNVTVDFIYVPARFSQPDTSLVPNEVVGPLEGFRGLSVADRPTSLVLGLGTEPGRSIGVKEQLDPYKTILFCAGPSIDPRYVMAVEKANSDLLRQTDKQSIIPFQVLDSVATFASLESVCTGLLRSYRLVLTSLGPKIFSLCCFLIATRYPEISVWRISTGAKAEVIDRRPTDKVVILEVQWHASRTE